MASSSLRRCPSDGDAKLLQILRRQLGQDRLIDVILAEHRLILSEADAPQPDPEVHTVPDLMSAGAPERLRSPFINGIKHWQVDYTGTCPVV